MPILRLLVPLHQLQEPGIAPRDKEGSRASKCWVQVQIWIFWSWKNLTILYECLPLCYKNHLCSMIKLCKKANKFLNKRNMTAPPGHPSASSPLHCCVCTVQTRCTTEKMLTGTCWAPTTCAGHVHIQVHAEQVQILRLRSHMYNTKRNSVSHNSVSISDVI